MNEPSPTLTFDSFWSWVVTHPNCILRAGAPEAVLYDDEDFHWHFATEGPEMILVQVIRGKRLVGELAFNPEHIAYVVATEDDGDFLFELVSEAELPTLFFVLSHGFDGDDVLPLTGRVH